MWAPATTFARPVMVTDRSARSSIGSISVAMAGLGSDVPSAGTTRAVFSIVSPKAGSAVPVAVNVAAPVTGTVMIALMSPVPVAAPQTAPPVPAQLQLTPVKAEEKISVTTASAAVVGPALVMVIVRSATGAKRAVDTEVELLSWNLSSDLVVTLAVFTMGSAPE